MPKVRVTNISNQWLVLNKLNVKMPPKSEQKSEYKDLFIDEKDLENEDIKELLSSGKITIETPNKVKPNSVSTAQNKETKGKRGRPKKQVAVQSKESIQRPPTEAKNSEKSSATIVKDGVPMNKNFTRSAEQDIFIYPPQGTKEPPVVFIEEKQ